MNILMLREREMAAGLDLFSQTALDKPGKK